MQTLIRVIPEKEPEHAEFYVHCKDQAIERLVEYVEQERYHSMMLTCYASAAVGSGVPISEICC